jgi:hypothetical protein
VVPVSRRNVAENALVSLKPISNPICVTDIEDSINSVFARSIRLAT